MELHSLKFVAFFSIVFALYYLLKGRKAVQKVILLTASCAFYALTVYISLFIISFWHEATWGYVLFGLYHATLSVPIILNNRMAKDLELKWVGGWFLHPRNIAKAAGGCLLIAIGGVIADADSLSGVAAVFKSWFGPWGLPSLPDKMNVLIFTMCGLVVVVKDYLDELVARHNIMRSNRPVWAVFALLVFFLRSNVAQEYIYQQF